MHLGRVTAGCIKSGPHRVGQSILSGQDYDVTGVFAAGAVWPNPAHHAVFGLVFGRDDGGEGQRQGGLSCGTPGSIRTCDHKIRSHVLCPAELRGPETSKRRSVYPTAQKADSRCATPTEMSLAGTVIP